MRVRLLSFFVLCGLLVVSATARAAEDKAPTVTIRIEPLDDLIKDARYLATMIGQGDKAREVEGFVKSLIGEKGLEGFDTKRPIGAYGNLGPNGIDSELVVLVPIVDEKTVLDTIGRLMIKPEKDKDGIYSFTPEGSPFAVHFRFANRYLYATVRDPNIIKQGKLLPPAAVLPPGKVSGLSIVLNFGNVPKEIREMILPQTEVRLAAMKEKKEGESAAQHAFRAKAVDELMTYFKSLVNDGGSLALKFGVEQKANELSMSMSFTPVPGTPLAKAVQNLAPRSSVAAGILGENPAFSGNISFGLTEPLRKVWEPVLQEGLANALKEQQDPQAKRILGNLIKVVTPTLKAAELDAAFAFRGPSAKKLYTAVMAAKVQDGLAIEKEVKTAVAQLPPEAQAFISIDAAKADTVNIHRLNVENQVDEGFKAVFGANPIYLAFRDNAVFLAAGEDGLNAIKEAAASKPASVPPMRIQVALRDLAQLMAKDQPGAPEAAGKAFTEKASDTVAFSLVGGKTLELRVTVKGPVLRFMSLLDEQTKGQ